MSLRRRTRACAVAVIAMLAAATALVGAGPASAASLAVRSPSRTFSPGSVATVIAKHDVKKITGHAAHLTKKVRCDSTSSRAKCLVVGTAGQLDFVALIKLGAPSSRTPFNDTLVLAAPGGKTKTFHLHGTVDL